MRLVSKKKHSVSCRGMEVFGAQGGMSLAPTID